MRDDSPPPSGNNLDARLHRAQARRAAAEGQPDPLSRGAGLSFALRITTELVVGIVVGVAIGWGLDGWLGTRPWLMIVFFFMGAGAGMLNVYRTVSGLGHGVGYVKAPRAGGEAKDAGRRPESGAEE